MDKIPKSDYFLLRSGIFRNKEIVQVAGAAQGMGKKVLLNWLPDHRVRKKLLRHVAIAIFDEGQMSELTKVDIKDLGSAKIAALKLYGQGAETVMIKMGTGEVLLFANEVFSFVDSLEQGFKLIVGRDIKLVEADIINLMRYGEG